ncbi:MAG TPA: CaiB/BaiF CoA-transferase family protein [Burkholderiales bacterium]|nr:CaiB/BaiF CoA-transferase family protein [Burkholderiales bacterium]
MKLAGVRVLDLALFLPGPHLTMMMADHGAEVIKVEPYDGGEPVRNLGLRKAGHSVWFRNTHRGKQSLRLNLKHPDGKEILVRLAEKADVLVEGFRPGVMERLGVGYAHVASRAPQLVYCSISAFGQTGRYRDKPAHDMAVEALAGVLGLNLGADGRPTNPGIPAGDMGASLMALSGILMALLRQRQTGRGDYLDVSLYDSLLAWTPNVQGPVFAEHRPHVVKHERNWGGAAFYNVYETKDGRYIALGGVEHKFAENFLNKAGRADLIPLCHQPPGPVQDPVKDYLRELFASQTLDEWTVWFEGVDVCWAPVRTLYDAMFDPATVERGMLLVDEQGVEHLGVPIRFTREPASPDLRLPEFGEHSVAIVKNLGYGDGEIERLRAEHVIG